jgi:predicted enzyme related to lactoylglutathione lyase
MVRFVRRALIAAAACCLFALGNTAVHGQAPAQGAIIGTGTFTSFVENMDRSLAFYHDVFGMDVPAMPESGERPYNRSNPQLFAMFDIPDAKERHQSARVPGTRLSVEVMEVQNVPHQTHELRIQDPGNATLVIVVRDIDAALASMVKANSPIVTPGGKPVTMSDGSRAILINDIDKRFIENPAARVPARDCRRVHQQHRRRASVDQRQRYGTDDQGLSRRARFTLEGETPFAADKAIRALTGLAKAEVRRSRVQARGHRCGLSSWSSRVSSARR